jgi:diguanylate cyclase (GGDEF)-like protein/putative nucleotidyltransferase with HDIG domain
VHYCPFCGFHRATESPTILSASCPACGCTISSCVETEFPQLARECEEQPFVAAPSADGSAMLTAILTGLLLLPALGARLGDFVFTSPLVVVVFAGVDCMTTRRLGGCRRGLWTWMATTAAFVALASLLAVLSAVVGLGITAGLYLGAAASVAMLVANLALARVTVLGAPLDRIVDGALICIVLLAAGMYFVGAHGFAHGDVILTIIFLIDLLSASVGLLSFAARPSARHRRVAVTLVGVSLMAGAGDGLAAAAAAHQLTPSPSAVALLWTVASFLIGVASGLERKAAEDADEERASRLIPGWIWMRVIVPLLCVLTFPAIALGIALTGRLTEQSAIVLGGLFVVTATISFARQAYLLVDNGRAVLRERRLRAEAMRRSAELEALTGLATTMTESLEETSILERGLAVLHLAAKATSAALYLNEKDAPVLRATAGKWQGERVWVTEPRESPELGIQYRGGRTIVRLPLQARETEIGSVTLLRPIASPFTESELQLLRLLVGQLALAVQNAHDYRDKLDQAIRDPLTGLYNRRFFYETLRKELHRTERFGTRVSIVLFDIDDFKSINDTFGHVAGDAALQRVAQIASIALRATDSLARVGGEEFALLLPQTDQLDALLVAERLRTAVARNEIIPGRRVTISGGVASCPQDVSDLDGLVGHADGALYWAKRNGKNMCAIASEVVVGSDEAPAEAPIAHLHAMVAAIDGQHLLTKDHSENVASYAVAVAQALGLSSECIVRLRRAGLLHDIGKAAVSREILQKPDKLTAAEFAEIKIHPQVGAAMLAHSGLRNESRWIRHHHERIDGRGYPDGLAGEQIPFESRILHVVDAFEAMTSDRPYHRGIPVDEAIAELWRCVGTQFDERIVAAMAALVKQGELTILATATATATAAS